MPNKLNDGRIGRWNLHDSHERASLLSGPGIRQYTLHTGHARVLIELFEREFIESQEALGMTLVGQFRDLDNPDRFVWLRGFADMTTRAQALQAFYSGPIWKTHREAANETMIDSDDVLLLRPARPAAGFSTGNVNGQPKGATENPRDLVVVTICHLKDRTGNDLMEFFERAIQSELTKAGVSRRVLSSPRIIRTLFRHCRCAKRQTSLFGFQFFRMRRPMSDTQVLSPTRSNGRTRSPKSLPLG